MIKQRFLKPAAWIISATVLTLLLAFQAACSDQRAALRDQLDRTAARIEKTARHYEDPANLGCLGPLLVLDRNRNDLSAAESAWAAGDYDQAESIIQAINDSLDRMTGQRGDEWIIAGFAGLNLMLAAVVVLLFRKRGRRHLTGSQ
ncbi:hypothetical protein [Dehalogenimonas sp. 4OHTPN]|uniref:Uncharacterized protein n=1 Tax=Dehalogenimonas sp. 4OHTPN TaxID=3166643 RepID=A0AAU8G8G8_9CHLR